MWKHHKIEKRKRNKNIGGTLKVQSLVVEPWPNNMG
jgi:hypothetical protein